jgi:hypothetical protein
MSEQSATEEKRITLQVGRDFHRRLKIQAARDDTSFNELRSDAVLDFPRNGDISQLKYACPSGPPELVAFVTEYDPKEEFILLITHEARIECYRARRN